MGPQKRPYKASVDRLLWHQRQRRCRAQATARYIHTLQSPTEFGQFLAAFHRVMTHAIVSAQSACKQLGRARARQQPWQQLRLQQILGCSDRHQQRDRSHSILMQSCLVYPHTTASIASTNVHRPRPQNPGQHPNTHPPTRTLRQNLYGSIQAFNSVQQRPVKLPTVKNSRPAFSQHITPSTAHVQRLVLTSNYLPAPHKPCLPKSLGRDLQHQLTP
jgi:hypothetical protein